MGGIGRRSWIRGLNTRYIFSLAPIQSPSGRASPAPMVNPTSTRSRVAPASAGSSPEVSDSTHLRATCEGGGRMAALTCPKRQTSSQPRSARSGAAIGRKRRVISLNLQRALRFREEVELDEVFCLRRLLQLA